MEHMESMNQHPFRGPLHQLRTLLHRSLCVGALVAGMHPGCAPRVEAATSRIFGITGPVLTGVVDLVDPEQGLLRVRCTQMANQPVFFHGMDNANFLTESGVAMTLAEIRPGMQVTIQFARWGRGWMISRVLLHDNFMTRPPAETEQLRGF